MGSSVLVLILLAAVAYSNCLEWVGDREVKYMPVPQNWYTAFEICRAEGMELLSVHNDQEYEHVKALGNKYKPRPSIWIGATDLGHEGSFVWMITGNKIGYGRFPAGQPDNYGGNENCLEITWRWNEVAQWNDLPCNTPLPYFCQRIPSCSNNDGCGCGH